MAQPPKVLEQVSEAARTDYQPKYMDAIQIKTESGGRQFDKSGKPLVGRYRDGTTPKQSERAYGAGQIQIATARRTAERHGIPFSENRLLNDRNYNLRLADRHMGDLLEKYGGDRTLARAAYHSGEGTVDRAIRKHGRQNFANGLGPHGRAYIQMGNGNRGHPNEQNAGNGGGASMSILDNIESAIAPTVEASGNVRVQAGNVFGQEQKIQSEQQAVTQDQQRQTSAIDVLSQALGAAHATQIEAKQAQIDETNQINEQMLQANQQLQEKIKPVFESRARIADQLDKLATMNPLEKMVRGVFDLNYDEDYLEGQKKSYDLTLQMRQSDYEQLGKAQVDAMRMIETRYGLATGMSDLLAEQAKANLNLAGTVLANSKGILDNTMTFMQQDVSQAMAQRQMRGATMGQLDGITLTKLMEQASQNGGIVDYNGVTLNYNELRQQAQDYESRERSIRASIIAARAGEMDLADKLNDDFLSKASREQVESIINAGGKLVREDGTVVQFDQLKLTQALNNHVQREGLMAEEMAQKIPAESAYRFAANSLGRTAVAFERAQGMFPAGSPANQALANTMLGQEAAYRELKEAIQTGKPQAYINTLIKKMQAAEDSTRAVMSQTILQSMGGDKIGAGYMESYIQGIPLDDASAAAAVSHFAQKGGIPDGMKMSAGAKQMFERAQQVVQRERTNNPKITKAQLDRIVADEVLSGTRQAIGGQNFSAFQSNLTQFARQDGNELGRISNSTWQQINTRATQDAATAFTSMMSEKNGKLGFTAKKVQLMAATGKPVSNSPQDKALYDAFKQNLGDWNQLTLRELVEEIDAIAPIKPGISNSQLLTEYVGSDRVRKRAEAQDANLANNSFGDSLFGPAARGATLGAINAYSQAVHTARESVYEGRRTQAKTFDRAFARNPQAMARVTLQAIEGVGAPGAQALNGFLTKVTATDAAILAGSGANQASRLLPSGVDSVLIPMEVSFVRNAQNIYKQALMNAKFDDPVMEAYRKKALQGWDKATISSESFVQSMTQGLEGALTGG